MGQGYLRVDLPIDHPSFGKVEPCICRRSKIIQQVQKNIFSYSNLDELKDLSFDKFEVHGNGNLNLLEIRSLEYAYETCLKFSHELNGWLLLEGNYGSGKTHLAAAIGNEAVELGVPTLFLTVPDMLDTLRFGFNDPELNFENRLNDIKKVKLLILDDFGTQNATSWAQEKLFQILNFRYINQLATVITTNVPLDEIEGRIRSRLQDKTVHYLHISARDYRLSNTDTSTPSLSSLTQYRDYQFKNFDKRDKELGKVFRSKEVTLETLPDGTEVKNVKTFHKAVNKEDLHSLDKAFSAAVSYAEDPNGWLVLLGQSGCGKTHLAAAIANHRNANGYPVVIVDTADLLDYLRVTFNPNVAVSLDRRFEEIRSTPLLILDALGEQSSTPWAQEKLYQILNYRYNIKLPTLITTRLSLDEIGETHPVILTRLLDDRLCSIYLIDMPGYQLRNSRNSMADKGTQSRKANPSPKRNY